MTGERPNPSPRPLSEVAAPHWLTQLLSTTTAPVHWGQLVRAAAALSVPIAVGSVTGHAGVAAGSRWVSWSRQAGITGS